jgi:ribosome-associated protein
LPDEVKVRLQALAGSRLTNDGVIVMTARTERTQERNRAVVVQRLVDLIRRASVRPIRRRATKPTKGSKERRLEGKAKRADVKRNRGQPSDKE